MIQLSFFEFPHTRTYDSDLGYVIYKLRQLDNQMQEFINVNQIKFADPIVWDILTSYAPYTIVIDDQYNGYISKQTVPAGINLDNDTYWQQIFTYDHQALEPLPVNILTLGGKNDGSVDIGPILNDNTGKNIYLPCGTYLIETPVVFNGQLIGAGFSRYKFDEPDECTVIKSNLYGGDLITLEENSVIRNMNIICNDIENAIRADLGLVYISDISISNLSGHGIHLEASQANSRQSFMNNISIHGKELAASVGIWIGNGTNDNRITNCEMMSVQKGIVLTRGLIYGSNLHIWTICTNMTAAWYQATVGIDATGNLILNNLYLDCNYRGITAGHNTFVSVTNVFTYGDSTQGGIAVTGQRPFTRAGASARFNIQNYYAFVSDNIDAIIPDAFYANDHISGVKVMSNQTPIYSNMAKFPLMGVIADDKYSIATSDGANQYTEIAMFNGWYGGALELVINDNNNNCVRLTFQNGAAPKFNKTVLAGSMSIGYTIVDNVYHLYAQHAPASATFFIKYMFGSIHCINLGDMINYAGNNFQPGTDSGSNLTIIS